MVSFTSCKSLSAPPAGGTSRSICTPHQRMRFKISLFAWLMLGQAKYVSANLVGNGC